MATNDRTIAEVLRMRLELSRYVDAADRELARMWGVAWQEISDEIEAAANELARIAQADDGWPARGAVLRNQRAVNALKVTVEAMRDLTKRADVTMTEDLVKILDSAETWTRKVAATQLPDSITLRWARVDDKALDAIVRRSTKRIHSLNKPLTAEAEARMKAVLIRGVAVGENPRAAARQIIKRAEGAFNGGLARANNIARTEMLDAHRQAALKSRMANADVLKGWRWHCEFSARTCPSCLAQHGAIHPIDEPGPLDHQQGRCTAVPVTKTWRDLGIDLDEPEPDYPDARGWFDQQPQATREQIMGKERLARYERGDLSWDQMSARHSTPGWRDSHRVAPLRGGGIASPLAPKPFHPSMLDDSDLESELSELMDAGDFDSPRMAELTAELDARDQTRARYADQIAQHNYEQAQKASGVPRRTSGPSKAAQERALRDEYETWVEIQMAAAENECRGVLLSHDGQREGVRPRDILTGKRQSQKWMSEELQEWFSRNPQMSYQQFRVGSRDDDLARAARTRSANRGWVGEFG